MGVLEEYNAIIGGVRSRALEEDYKSVGGVPSKMLGEYNGKCQSV